MCLPNDHIFVDTHTLVTDLFTRTDHLAAATYGGKGWFGLVSGVARLVVECKVTDHIESAAQKQRAECQHSTSPFCGGLNMLAQGVALLRSVALWKWV